MKLLKFKIEPGQEVMETLEAELKLQHIQVGAIVSVLGGIDECCISNMSQHDPKQDILTEYNVPMELSGTGEVIDGKPHLHCTLSREGDMALHGHLRWAKVRTWFVLVFVLVD